MTLNQQPSAVVDDSGAIIPLCISYFAVAGQEASLTVGVYEDGQPDELIHHHGQRGFATHFLRYFPRSLGKEKTDMECDLCKREPSVSGSLLCATCAEAIQRLVAIHREASVAGEAASDSVQAGAHKITRGAGHRDS